MSPNLNQNHVNPLCESVLMTFFKGPLPKKKLVGSAKIIVNGRIKSLIRADKLLSKESESDIRKLGKKGIINIEVTIIRGIIKNERFLYFLNKMLNKQNE
jgi:hypothetical protein